MHLHGARVDDVELYLGRATIVGVSRAIEQTFFISVIYCLIQIVFNINLSTKYKVEIGK